MKKKITINIPEKVIPASTREKEIEVCDMCQENESMHKCSICGRELCSKCCIADYCSNGDYPDFFCKICHELRFKKYKQELLDMELRHEKEIDDYYKKIKEESLKGLNNDYISRDF